MIDSKQVNMMVLMLTVLLGSKWMFILILMLMLMLMVMLMLVLVLVLLLTH